MMRARICRYIVSVAILLGAASAFAQPSAVTLVFAGDGSTGSRTIPQDAFFTCVKVASTRWYVRS